MRVLRDYVLIKEEKVEERKSATGIIMTTDSREAYTTPKESIAISIGPDVKGIKEGDTILHMPKGGVHIDKDDCVWRFLKESDIIAVMND